MTTYNKYTPNFKCSTDSNGKGQVNASIGLISYDEVVYAGGYPYQNNSNYYLYDSTINWWTMSPAGFSSIDSCIWRIYNTGNIANDGSNFTDVVRPIIVIKDDTQILSGTGTSSNPYVIN